MRIFFTALLLMTAVLAQIPTPRQEVLAEMETRPGDPWPRGIGHVLLAVPGSIEKQKAYHEPGGSFSPEVGSFGVSIWITDPKGAIPKWVVNYFQEDWPRTTFKGLRTQVAKANIVENAAVRKLVDGVPAALP